MKHYEHPHISAEQLNAYIDDEMAYEERERISRQMEQDPQLCQEAHELRQLRAMLRHAYRNPPQPEQATKPSGSRNPGLTALAASLLLVVGALFGWLGNGQLGTTPQAYAQLAITSTPQNVLLHLSSSDPQKMSVALDYAEQLLTSYHQQGKKVELELLTNDGGTELLRRDTSPFVQRIRTLQSKYGNIRFLACANALQRLREQGVQVELLPGTQSDRNAIDAIVQRLEGGWRYLRV